MKGPAHFSPRKTDDSMGEDERFNGPNGLLLMDSRNTAQVGIKYILFKLCITVGRLAPVDSGSLKTYSQYLVNSSVTLF